MASMTRREAVVSIASTALAAQAAEARGAAAAVSGRLNQSVCQWCYDKMPLEELCRRAKEMGFKSVELLGEKDWPVVKKYALTCAMANGPTTIPVGFNRPDQHDRFIAESGRLIPIIASYGFPNMIVFSGNRQGMSDGEGVANCVKGLTRLMPIADQHGVTICMELLNSKVDHKDYQCDHTAWGVEVVKGVGSPRFKLLYDIYHMQIMEGDVIRTIRDNAAHIGHFHTGGVPGRNEIDETQELNYRRIAQSIVDLGFTGYLAQEFIPKRDPMTSLRQGHRICDV
jgi:hydroxypyruvate isomerase